MRYELELYGKREVVSLEERGGKLYASVDERPYELQAVSPERGVYLFFSGDTTYEARVWTLEPQGFTVKLRGELFSAKLADRKHIRAAGEQSGDGQQLLTAPMPGKVVKVLCEPGAQVAAGQGVVVVEAMKMQNEVKSLKAGRVSEIRVKEGMTVMASQVLAVVE